MLNDDVFSLLDLTDDSTDICWRSSSAAMAQARSPMEMGMRMTLPVDPWETKHSDHQIRSG